MHESEPEWRPPAAALGAERCDDFMWMGRRGSVERYKHRFSRRYLNIDRLTGAFESDDGAPLTAEQAIDHVCPLRP